MKTSKALVLDAASGSRGAIRRLIVSLGLPTNNIEAVETMEEALAVMNKNRPNIVVTEMVIGGRSGFELLKLLREYYPSGLQTVFIFLTAKRSPIVNSLALESEADAMVVKPFNVNQMEASLIQACQPKSIRPNYLVSIENAKIEIREKNFDVAVHLLNDAIQQDPKPFLAYSNLGKLYFDLEKWSEAEKAFESALKFNPKHYHSLLGLFDVFLAQKRFKDAYFVCSEITKNNAFPMKRVPDFVKVAVHNQKYTDVLEFFEIVSDYEYPDDAVVSYLAAAMVVCAKSFIKSGELGRGLDFLQKAQSATRSREKIQIEIISALYASGLEREADNFMRRVSDEIRNSVEMRVMEMEHFLRTNNIDLVMRIGAKLVKENAKSLRLYEIMIEQSKKLNRPKSSVNDLCIKAIQHFPEKKSVFTQMVQDYEPTQQNSPNFSPL